jgi:pyruvate dehydrogenase E2 component (dihydrolipoamide acetyltransferase)
MRSAIAAQMVKSVTTIPHFFVTSKLHLDPLIKMRASLKPLPQYEGITYTHLLIKAAGIALRKVPRINSVYKDGTLVEQGEINIGIITALEDGLLIPVMKNADGSRLSDIVSESRALVQRARSGRPKPDDLVGGTFAISNMGRYDVESFTAIINPNHGAILAVSGMQEEAIVEDGEVTVGNVMRVTLSVDHRIIDGLMAGEFLTELKRLIEDPVLLLA